MMRVHRAMIQPIEGMAGLIKRANYQEVVVRVRGDTETELKAAELFFDDLTKDPEMLHKMVMAHVAAKRLIDAIAPQL